MSKIRCDNNSSSISIYNSLLQNKISIVCKKIGFNDTGISWVIFDAKKFYSNNIIGSVLVGTRGKDYGFFNILTNEIWISTKAIQRGSLVNSVINTTAMLMGKPSKQDDFLADVLLDEITHYQTGANHGTTKYDNKLKENRKRYYGVYL